MMGEGGGCVEGGGGGTRCYWLLDTTATATLPQDTQKVESRKKSRSRNIEHDIDS